MKLRKLELNNFRQFYGKQEVVFSTHKDKNITLIHGENGSGKSALLNAILWCFFNEVTDNFSEPESMQNKVARTEGKLSYSVQIEFEDDEAQTYLVQRVVRSGQMTFRVYKNENNSFNEISNPISFINSVIPRDMAKYFFFSGEDIGNISGNKGGSVVKAAIKEILGFTVAELALEDIRRVKREYQNSLASSDKSGRLQQLQSKLESLEDKIKKNISNIANDEKSKYLYVDKIEDIDLKLRTADSAVIKGLHNNRTTLEASLAREKSFLSRATREKQALISEYSTIVFGYNLSKLALDFIDESQYRGTIPAPYNEQLVQDILNCQQRVKTDPLLS